jgi:hypothetical protein
VRTAAQLEVLNHILATIGIRVHVMEFEKSPLGASPFASHERALPAVPLPHAPAHVSGDVARMIGRDAARSSGPICAREFLLFQVADEHLQRSIDDDRDVTIRNRVAHEVLRTTK